MTILGFLFFGLLYVGMPVFFYYISSYSISLLNKHYNKKTSSGISWVPFVRYYDFTKQATKSPRKAFIITLLPWIITGVGILGGIIVGIIEKNIDITSRSWTLPAFMTFSVLIVLGILSIVGMNFWRAFIISRYVK
jgi:hypothetical protein